MPIWGDVPHLTASWAMDPMPREPQEPLLAQAPEATKPCKGAKGGVRGPVWREPARHNPTLPSGSELSSDPTSHPVSQNNQVLPWNMDLRSCLSLTCHVTVVKLLPSQDLNLPPLEELRCFGGLRFCRPSSNFKASDALTRTLLSIPWMSTLPLPWKPPVRSSFQPPPCPPITPQLPHSLKVLPRSWTEGNWERRQKLRPAQGTTPAREQGSIRLAWPFGLWAFKTGFPGGASGKEPTCQYRRPKRLGFDPWVWKIPSRRALKTVRPLERELKAPPPLWAL